MGYISYFDLLGTKGFITKKDEYRNNIQTFYGEIKKSARKHLLEKESKVHIFSDSVYVYSSNLENLINFEVELRNTLNSEGLFFNSVIKEGLLGIEELKNNVISGAVFENDEIIDLYYEQTNFKGIGIRILDNEENMKSVLKNFNVVESIFYDHRNKKFVPYFDIGYPKNFLKDYPAKEKHLLSEIIKNALKAYSVNTKHGGYYLSLFVTLLRSYNWEKIEWNWNTKEKNFGELPPLFTAVVNLASGKYEECRDWIGIDVLCFVLFDILIQSEKLSSIQLSDIIGTFLKYPSLKGYSKRLTEIPDFYFTNSENKNKFCEYAQNYFQTDLVDKLIKN